jgi:hypothetical protein
MGVVPFVTICKTCAHFHNREPSGPRSHVWYNHFCKATPLPTKIDPYDGATKAYSVNDLGSEYFTDDKFERCRKVNDGRCPKWKASPGGQS